MCSSDLRRLCTHRCCVAAKKEGKTCEKCLNAGKKKDETKKETVQRVRRRGVRAPAFVEVYSNTSQGAFTPWDIEITFGRLDVLDDEPIVSELVTVLFSPQHAKAVAKVLESAVQKPRVSSERQ